MNGMTRLMMEMMMTTGVVVVLLVLGLVMES